jgi:hypothetical protein
MIFGNPIRTWSHWHILWSVKDAFIKYQTPFHLENNDWVRQCESGLENTNNIVRDRSTIWNIEKQTIIKYDM